MSQHTFAISNEAGAAFRGDVNSALQALASQSSGAAAPGTTYAYQVWVDTTTNTQKRRNAANSAWIARDTLDETFVISRAANTIMGQSDRGKTFRCTSSFTQTLTAAATLADGWWAQFVNDNAAGAGVITFDPNASETIDGATTIVLNPGESFIVNCNGASFYTVGRSSRYVAMPRSYLAGLQLAFNSVTATDIALGKCRDSTDAADIILTAAITGGILQAAGAWAAGSSQNKLDTGARANSTWYHVWAIRKDSDGTGDWLYSTSVSAPTMPSGYTFKRRIGAVKTDGSGNIVKFFQYGDLFIWDVPVQDFSVTNPGTAAVLRALSTPLGVKVEAIGILSLELGSSAAIRALVTAPDQTDTAPSTTIYNHFGKFTGTGTAEFTEEVRCMTNTSSQVRVRQDVSAASDQIAWVTKGWRDYRGADQ